jgi:hypothetical protein
MLTKTSSGRWTKPSSANLQQHLASLQKHHEHRGKWATLLAITIWWSAPLWALIKAWASSSVRVTSLPFLYTSVLYRESKWIGVTIMSQDNLSSCVTV